MYSMSIRQLFNTRNPQDNDIKIVVPYVPAGVFEVFLAWIYTGSISAASRPSRKHTWNKTWPNLWVLGGLLESPGFQNYCMDQLRLEVKERFESKCYDPLALREAKVIRGAGQDTKLWILAAHVLGYHNPFKIYTHAPEYASEWTKFLKSSPQFSVEIILSGVTEWDGEMPWDDCNRQLYVVDEDLEVQEMKRLMLRGNW